MISRFSKRTDWKLTPNELSSKFKELKDQGTSVIDLTASNPTQCQFNYLNSELLSSFNISNNLTYTPDPKGSLVARKIIQNDYAKKQIHIDPEHIFLTASTSEAYSFILRLLTNPGDHILVPQPSYPLFQFLADLNDVVMDHYSLTYDNGWQIDLESFRNQTKKQAKAIVLVNPNNPTGSFVKQSEFDSIVKLAKEKNFAIISDEVFFDYNLNNSPQVPCASSEVLTFTLGGISKSLGLPQMKLAWILVNGPEPILKEASQRLELIQDTYLSVNIPVQNAFSNWFSKKSEIQSEIKNRIEENQNFLLKNLPEGITYLKPQGGWNGILKIPVLKTEEELILQLLVEDHVLIHPGYFFDFEEEGYLVLSLIVPPNIFQEGVTKILKRIESNRQSSRRV